MPQQLESIIQRMIDAGESEENISIVIRNYNTTTGKAQPISVGEPGTFAGGVMKSLTSGEALGAGLRGAGGFLRGAIADLPASLYGGLQTIGGMITSPIETGGEIIEGVRNLPGQIAETTMRAGSQPEEFGRMMGQMTGQPLVTAGIAKGAPKIPAATKTAVSATGKPVEIIGREISRGHGPISGILPPFTTPRYLRYGERMLGKGIEQVGKKMQGKGKEEIPTPIPGSKLIKEKKIPSDFMTNVLREVEEQLIKEGKFPSVELPPPQYSLGAMQPPEQPRVSIPKKSSGTETLETAPIGQIVKLKQKSVSIETVKELKAQGFEFQDLMPDGSMKFKKIGTKTEPVESTSRLPEFRSTRFRIERTGDKFGRSKIWDSNRGSIPKGWNRVE